MGALLVIVVTEIVSLGAVRPPGEMGADIVAAEGQSLGNALNFGGPYVGLFATREKFVRQMPGRLVGETVDADGRRGWALTLSTREQHIRREKATSNICTNSGLCALAFTIHLTLLGEAGMTRLARLNHVTAVTAAERLAAIAGVRSSTGAFSTNSRCVCRGRRRGLSRRWRGAEFLAVSRSAGSIRDGPSWPICCWSRRPRPSPKMISTGSKPASGRCCDERVEPGSERTPVPATRAARSTRSVAIADYKWKSL